METPPKAKVAITLRTAVLEEVRGAVAEGRARSVSAYIEHAVSAQLAAEADFDVIIAEMLAETGGPATDVERADARRMLTGAA
jgi:Arc/MetJ-type ribon-helix-helix transcriptional regulator